MKNGLLLLLLLQIGLMAAAQESVVVIYASGPVYYRSGQSAGNKKIYAGQTLPLQGVLRCERGGLAKLRFEGKVHQLTEGRTYNLGELAANQDAATGGFARRFWNFLMESVRNTDSNENLERYHQRYMERASGSIRGWAEREYQLAAQPFPNGRIGDGESLQFNWSRFTADSTYVLQVLAGDGSTLLYWRTRDTTLEVDGGQLALLPGDAYEWTVFAGKVAPGAPQSATYYFTYVPAEAERILRQLETDPDYRQALPLEQALMRAQVLEEADFFNAARLSYETALREWPDDLLLRRVYAGFLARVGELPAGQRLLGEGLRAKG